MKRSVRMWCALAVAGAITTGVVVAEGPGGAVAAAPAGQGGGPGGADQQEPPEVETIAGVLTSVNMNPHGQAEGFIVTQGTTTVQLNCPPEVAGEIVSKIKVGDQVKATGTPDHGPPGMQNDNQDAPAAGSHAVYRLQSITMPDGKVITDGGPGAMKKVHMEGTIAALNYDRRGDVDGAQLDTGDYVHIGGDAAKLKLAAGGKLSVDGRSHPLFGSTHSVIEASKVNGTKIKRQQRGPGGPDGMGPPPGGPDGMGGPGGGPGGDGNGPPPPPNGN